MDRKINKYRGPDHWYNPTFFEALHGKPIQYLSDLIGGGEHILDIGAGDGRLTYLLNQLTGRVVGLEYQWMPIRFAQLMFEVRETSHIPFVQGEATFLPFKKDSFDMVTLFDVIEHIPPEVLIAFLDETKWVLKARGKLVLTTPNRRSLRNRLWGHRINPKHYQEYNVTELKRLLDESGFIIENIKGIFIPVPIPKLEHYGSVFPFRKIFNFFINAGENLHGISETIFLIAGRK